MYTARVSEPVSFELHESVAVVRIDDGKANALSPSLVEPLLELLPRAQAEAKALVLLGRPGCFSAGFDLRVMMSGPAAATSLLERGAELFMQLYAHPQPVVAGVSGHAIAGGVLLSAACDLRIGAAGAFKLGLNEIAIGMPLPILAHELARDRLDRRRYTEATLFARLYAPDEAVEVGWLDRVVEADALESSVIAAAAELGKLPKGPFAKTKLSTRGATIEHIRTSLAANLAGMHG